MAGFPHLADHIPRIRVDLDQLSSNVCPAKDQHRIQCPNLGRETVDFRRCHPIEAQSIADQSVFDQRLDLVPLPIAPPCHAGSSYADRLLSLHNQTPDFHHLAPPAEGQVKNPLFSLCEVFLLFSFLLLYQAPEPEIVKHVHFRQCLESRCFWLNR